MFPSGTHRRLLLIVGDGNDRNDDVGQRELPRLRDEAARRHVTISVLVVKSAVSAETELATILTPDVRKLDSPANLAEALDEIWTRAR